MNFYFLSCFECSYISKYCLCSALNAKVDPGPWCVCVLCVLLLSGTECVVFIVYECFLKLFDMDYEFFPQEK